MQILDKSASISVSAAALRSTRTLADMSGASANSTVESAPTRFGPGLSVALVIPAIATVAIVGALLAGVFAPRSPYVVYCSGVVAISGLVELVALSAASARLVRNPPLRNPRNVALVAVGVVAVLPSLVVYMRTLYG